MRRLAVSAALLLFSIGLAAEAQKARGRWGALPDVVAPPAVLELTVTDPVSAPSYVTTEDTIILRGIARILSGNTILNPPTWSCPTCSPTSGTTVLTNEAWETPSAASGGTVTASDDFTGASTVDVTQTVPVVGSAWTLVMNTATDATYYVQRRSGGYIQPSVNQTTGLPKLIALATPTTALGTNYTVSVTLTHASTPGFDDMAGIVFGSNADASDSCAVAWYGPAAVGDDIYVIKRVAGVVSTIASANIDPAANDVILVDVNGPTILVTRNGATVITTSDGACDNASGVGVGYGSLRDVPGDDLVQITRLDNVEVVDRSGGSVGITLASGANPITITLTDSAGTTPRVVLFTATKAGADIVAPVVTITSPTPSPTYPTSTAAIAIEGTCQDTNGCATVTLGCPTCSTTAPVCTVSGTAPDQTFACASTNLASGANTLTATGTDADTNAGNDALAATYTPADATPPSCVITTNGGVNYSTSISTLNLIGTASDNVQVASVTISSNVGTVGAVTGLEGWSAPATLAVGANIFSCVARDQADNPSTADTITITYNAGTLAITTTGLPGGRAASAYNSQTLVASGGTTPYTWSNNAAGTSLNDADAHCAGLVISSGGVVSGTPTTAGTCDWTAKVTDNVAATDTQALSIVVATAGSEGPNDYFTSLVARGDCYKAFSLRPVVGQPASTNCSSPYYEHQIKRPGLSGYLYTNSPKGRITYDYAADTDPNKQDATKFTIPAFELAPTITVGAPVGINDPTLTIQKTGAFSVALSHAFRIGSATSGEILVSTSPAGQALTFPINRAQFGTTATTHDAGTAIYTGNHNVGDQLRLPLGACTFATVTPSCTWTDGTLSASYLYTWDGLWTSSYVNTGLTNHKTFQFSSAGDSFWFEPNTRFENPSCCPEPLFNPAVHVATISGRSYGPSVSPSTSIEPLQPISNHFILEANKWVRFWVLFEVYADGDASGFGTVTTLTADVAIDALTITINHPSTLINNPFTFTPYYVAGGTAPNNWPGRTLRIGSEIMTVVSGPTSGSPRTITVARAAHGTTIAAHSSGGNVQLSHDYVTMWVADEDSEPTLLYNRLPLALYGNKTLAIQRGSLLKFWTEYNTSLTAMTQQRAATGFADLVAYAKNFVGLMNPPADWSALRVKPVR